MKEYHIYCYIIALINHIGKASAASLSRTLEKYSHDFFTDILKRDWEGEKLLRYSIQRIHPLTAGWLVIDDTWLPKCFSAISEFVSKVYSGKHKRPMWGMSVVMLLWTDGKWRIPLDIRVWLRGGKTKPELALEMLSTVRNKLRWKPRWVCFDCGYAAASIMKRIHAYGWVFICGVPKSRRIDGVALSHFKHQGYWNGCGEAWYGQKLKFIRVKDRFYACNRLLWNRKTILGAYSGRVIIEEVFRILKQTGGWIGCQSQNYADYQRHLYLCLVHFLVLEATRIQEFNGKTIYQIRQNAISSPKIFVPLVLKRFPKVA